MEAIPECSGNNPRFKGTECSSNKAESQVLLYASSIGKRKYHASAQQNLNLVCIGGKGGLQKQTN